MTTGSVVEERIQELIEDFNNLQYRAWWGLEVSKYPIIEFPGRFRFHAYFEEGKVHLYFVPLTGFHRDDLQGMVVWSVRFTAYGAASLIAGQLDENAKVSFHSRSREAGDYAQFFLGPNSRQLAQQVIDSPRGLALATGDTGQLAL